MTTMATLAVNPTGRQLKKLSQIEPTTSIYMFNLLKFKKIAKYNDDDDRKHNNKNSSITGREAYIKYAAALGDGMTGGDKANKNKNNGNDNPGLLQKYGGKLVYFADPPYLSVVGSISYDVVAIVWYPSVNAFLQMVSSNEYQSIHRHREAGLQHQLLICCKAPSSPSPSSTTPTSRTSRIASDETVPFILPSKL